MSSNNNNNKMDFVAISLNDSSTSTSYSYPPSSKLFCNLCSCNLILLDSQTEKWFCNRCNITYHPAKEKVKRPNRLYTPDPETDKHGNIIGEKVPIVSMIDDTSVTNVKPKKSVFPRSLEMLKRPGVNIKDFSSTVDNEGI
jgi:hypothetical protein